MEYELVSAIAVAFHYDIILAENRPESFPALIFS
jgi:hypothetical protein